jgi:hypothetical protein
VENFYNNKTNALFYTMGTMKMRVRVRVTVRMRARARLRVKVWVRVRVGVILRSWVHSLGMKYHLNNQKQFSVTSILFCV